MVAFDDSDCHVTKKSEDIRGIRRWGSFTITRKKSLKTTMLNCYCPVVSDSPGSDYSQQLIYMSKKKDKIPNDILCPRKLFGHDLKEVIYETMNLEYQLIVCGDVNF